MARCCALFPVVWILSHTAVFMVHLLGGHTKRVGPMATEEDIAYLIRVSHEEGVFKPEQGLMLQSVITFRDTSVRELQQRFRVDATQAQRVRLRALALWQELAEPQANPDGEHARELGWASALHEIGMMVSHHDHHRHSAYLLGHVDASSFSQSQLRRLATLVLGQRGELIKLVEHFHDQALMSQVLCLRLAIILHHARVDLPPRVVSLQRSRGKIKLALNRRWAAQHPRTLHLLDEEARRWSAQGRRSLELSLVA